MFWDMWRNLTNATSNWTHSSWSSDGSSSRNKSSRYNRLRSGPTKSYSHPANLAGVAETPSLESLDKICNGNEAEAQKQKNKGQHNTNGGQTNPIKKKSANKQQTIKNSFTTSSFLSFSAFRADNECSSKKLGYGKKDDQIVQGKTTSSEVDAGIIPTKTADDEVKDRCPLPILNSRQTGQQNAECCVLEHVISDLVNDDEDDRNHLACDVCDRAFPTYRKLADHQRKKRHYGCVQCDTLFPDREGLDTHREQMCHYEFAIDMAGYRDYGDDGDDTDSFITDDDENGFGYSDEGDDEEMERLL